MNSYMKNSNQQDRGFGQTLQGTANSINNTGAAGYVYHLTCYRQYTWDSGYDNFVGTWSPDER